MQRSARPLTTFIAAFAVLLLLAAPAHADYPPSAGEVVDATVIVETPDATIEIEGDDWSGETVVEITYTDADGTVQVLGEATTDADGSFTTAVTLPDGVDPTEVSFSVTDTADGDTQSFTLASTDDGGIDDVADDAAVGDRAGDGADEALAATGAPGGAIALASALLTAGVLAVGGARWWSRRLDAVR